MRQLAIERQFRDEATMTEAAVPFDTTSDQTVPGKPRTFQGHNLPSLQWYSDQGANDKNFGHTFLNMTTALLMTVAMVARGITGGFENQICSLKSCGQVDVVERSTQRDSSLLEAFQRQGPHAERLTMWNGLDLATETTSARRSVQFFQSCQPRRVWW